MKIFLWALAAFPFVALLGFWALGQAMKPSPVPMSFATDVGIPIAGWNRAVELADEGLAQEHVTWEFWRAGHDELMRMVFLRAHFEPVPDALPRFAESPMTIRARVVNHLGVDFGERELTLVREGTYDEARWALDRITFVD